MIYLQPWVKVTKTLDFLYAFCMAGGTLCLTQPKPHHKMAHT